MKKLFLAVVPAIALLAGCSGQPKVNVANAMVEDTLAHEEIFGALPDFEQDEKLVRKQLPDSGLWTPVLGFQDKPNLDGTTSIRIVAAVQSTVTSLTWTRNIHNITGVNAPKKAKKNIEVSTIYEKLSEGGDVYTEAKNVVELDDDTGAKPFGYYAVYCLLNVPSAMAHYYVNTFITISDGDHTTKSCGAVVNVADSDDVYFYSVLGIDRNAGFINKIARESDPLGESKDLFYYKPVSLTSGDTLEAFYIDETNLTIAKNTAVTLSEEYDYFSLNDTTKTVTVSKTGEFNAYLNGSSVYYFTEVNYHINITAHFDSVSSWATPNTCKFHAWNSENPNGVCVWDSEEESMTRVGNTWTYTYSIPLTNNSNITNFVIYFREGSVIKESYGSAYTQTLEPNHSYDIVVNPTDWGKDADANKFWATVTVTDVTPAE